MKHKVMQKKVGAITGKQESLHGKSCKLEMKLKGEDDFNGQK